MRGKAIIEGDAAGNGNGSGSSGNGTSSIKAGKGGKGKTQRKRSGEGKPAVVITELPYQTNKVHIYAHSNKTFYVKPWHQLSRHCTKMSHEDETHKDF